MGLSCVSPSEARASDVDPQARAMMERGVAMPKPYYSHAGIEIFLGDYREILHKLPVADLLLTDPPYDADYGGSYGAFTAIAKRVVLTPGKQRVFDWPRPDWIYCWLGHPSSMGGSFCMHISWEPVLCWGKPIRPLGRDCLEYPSSTQPDAAGHPWPKPLPLWLKLMKHFSPEGGLVLDPFLGSGTTVKAAKKLGRRAIGIEIEEKYCEIAAKRLNQEVFSFE
jgi:site-specific DNA-methyltransferase (adenine-specific)